MERIITGDALAALRQLPAGIAHTCVTSPPYFGLRDYGAAGQIGFEDSPEAFVLKLVEVFRELRRVLRDDGTLWLNLGDTYATAEKGGSKSKPGDKSFTNKGTLGIQRRRIAHGLKPKDLIGIPWRAAFALQADGWYLRQDIIWHKPNAMPESVTDRCTKAHEYVFLMSKSKNYYFDHDALKEQARFPFDNRGGRSDARRGTGMNSMSGMAGQFRNKRSVWTVPTKPYKGAHFAAFPPALIEPCILAGAPLGGVVLDPFLGSGTTAAVARAFGRGYIGIELNPSYISLVRERLRAMPVPLAAE